MTSPNLIAFKNLLSESLLKTKYFYVDIPGDEKSNFTVHTVKIFSNQLTITKLLLPGDHDRLQSAKKIGVIYLDPYGNPVTRYDYDVNFIHFDSAVSWAEDDVAQVSATYWITYSTETVASEIKADIEYFEEKIKRAINDPRAAIHHEEVVQKLRDRLAKLEK